MILATSHLIDVSRKHLDWFLRQTIGTEYHSSGVLPSEMLCFCALAREQGYQDVVESGRKHGFSTEILMRCRFKTISFELDPVEKAQHRLARLATENTYDLNMRTGDFEKFAHEILDTYQCPLLLDGPKGRVAIRIVQDCLPCLPFAAIHDMSKEAEGHIPNTGRVALDESGLEFVIVGDEFAEEFGDLDSSTWESDYASRDEMTRYGFHMAIIKGNKWRD